MTSFTPTKSSNPCPVCGDMKGKCRTTDGDLVLCMELEQAPGWKSLGLTKNGLWTRFVPDTGETSAEQRRRDWQLKKQALAAAEAQRQAEAMPAVERDRHYRQLLSQLSLHPDDRTDLERRGYTAEQIKDAGYKSVEKWQRLEFELPHTLPGVSLDGRSLTNSVAGYLCSAFSADGLIVGFQVRRRGDGPGKSRWLSSYSPKYRPNGPQPKTKEFNENPLTVHQNGPQIALAEGIGAKPSLAALRTGYTVIGAAGGQWASSPATFKETLRSLNAKPEDTVTLFTDAGDIDKPGPMRRWKATAELLQQWGYSVQVWAGTADIDEVPAAELAQLTFISLEQWLEPISEVEATPKNSWFEQTKLREQSEWIGDLSQRLGVDLPSDLASARVKAEAVLREQQQLPQANAVVDWVPGLKLGSFNARKLYALDCQKMTGKSSTGIASIAKEALATGQRCLIIVPYRSLTMDMAKTLREKTESKDRILTHREYFTQLALAQSPEHTERARNAAKAKLDAAQVLVICPESLHLFSDKAFRMVILDEANEVINRVEEGNLGTKPRKNRAVLDDKLASAHTVVLATDQLYRCTLDAVIRKGHFAQNQIEFIQRRREQADHEIKLFVQEMTAIEKWDGTHQERGSKNLSLFAWLKGLVDAINCGQSVAIPCGSQKMARKIDRLLRKLCPGKQGQCIDGKYTPKGFKQTVVGDADKYLFKGELDWFIFSPAMNSGCSIDGLHFDAQFEYVTPFETATSASQRGERVRDVIKRARITQRWVYISTQGLPKLPNPETLFPEYWQQLIEAEAEAPASTRAIAKAIGAEQILKDFTQQQSLESLGTQELPQFLAIRAREVLFKLETLKAEWASNGWSVADGHAIFDQQIESALHEVKEGLINQKSLIQAKAKPASDIADESKSARHSFQLTKAGQVRKLGDFDLLNDPRWQAAWSASPEARGTIEAAQTRAAFNIAHTDTAQWRALTTMAALRTIVSATPDIDAELPTLPISHKIIQRIEILKACPYLWELLSNPETIYTKIDQSIQAIAAYTRENAARLACLSSHSQRIHGLQFTHKTPDIKCFHRVLKMLGVETQNVGRTQDKYWRYQIKPIPSKEQVSGLLNKFNQADESLAKARKTFRCEATQSSLEELRQLKALAYGLDRAGREQYREATKQLTINAAEAQVKAAISPNQAVRALSSISAEISDPELQIDINQNLSEVLDQLRNGYSQGFPRIIYLDGEQFILRKQQSGISYLAPMDDPDVTDDLLVEVPIRWITPLVA